VRKPAKAAGSLTIIEGESGAETPVIGHTIVKLSLAYARVKVCATRAVNHLLKITSVRSRGLDKPADIEFCPLTKTASGGGASRVHQVTGLGISSHGTARRPWCNRPCEPRVPTHLPHRRPKTVPKSVLSHGRTHLRKSRGVAHRPRATALSEAVRSGCESPRFIVKESVLNERQVVSWSAPGERGPL